MNKDFIIDMLFDKPELKWVAKRKFDKKKDLSSIQNEEFDLPLVNAKNGNNGIMYFGRSSDFSSVEGGIDIVNDGAVSAGNVYPQPHRIGVLYNAYIITLKNGMNTNRQVLEYLACVMEKTIKYRFNYSNKAGWDKVKEISISLPIKVDENNKPIIDDTYFYHKEGFIPDFNYMEKYIAELEGQRIAELEGYLVATGLNDYVLTEEDKQILSLSTESRFNEDSDNENVDRNGLQVKLFSINKLFKLQTVSKKLAKTDLSNNFEYPTYSSESTNNGILGYCETPTFICNETTPVYVIFGDHTRTLNIARKSFSVLDNVKVLVPCINKDEVLLYINSIWGKQIPNLGYARHWKVAKDCKLPLPIKLNEDKTPMIDTECKYHKDGYLPDFEFMEKYIRVIEKLVIADVVKYKDKIIEKSKEVTTL